MRFTWKLVALGVVAGMRTSFAPALASSYFNDSFQARLRLGRWRWIAKPAALRLLTFGAAGEFFADKLPGVPNRTETSGLIGRSASGALTGAVLGKSAGESVRRSAVIGGVAALAGTFAAFHARRYLTHEAGVPDPIVAVAEDVAAIALGAAALDRLSALRDEVEYIRDRLFG